MEIKEAEFVISHPKESACPSAEEGVAEFAFIGRSNVGKSSLINMLTGKKGLAKVSATPGKTQLLNYFIINKKWYLVDLPGYGYARVSKAKQKVLADMIDGYFRFRPTLALAFVLIDASIPPTRIDLTFVNGLGELGVPFVLLFTKADKQSAGKSQQNIDAFMAKLAVDWETLPEYIITSSIRRTGREEILQRIHHTLKKI